MIQHITLAQIGTNFLKNERFGFKSFFNRFVGVLAWVVKPLGERSPSFDGDTVAQFSVGIFPELGRKHKLDDYNE